MREALSRLMKDEIEEELSKGREEGKADKYLSEYYAHLK